ncbi:MAG: hypothetical protein KGZ88_09620 [Methylomicrobium sp.]|nr:hypothetical protein [Methylomicrobium sp.]
MRARPISNASRYSYALGENVLAEAYHRFLAFPENQNLHGRREFQSNIRLLTGSFLNRTVSSQGPATIDLFNPSIGDFVLERYAGDAVALRLGIQSLRTLRSLITLRSLQSNEHLSTADTKSICDALIGHFAENKFDGVGVAYVSALCDVYRGCGGFDINASAALRASVLYIINKGMGEATDDSFEIVEWSVEKSIVTPEQALSFIAGNINIVNSYTEIQAISSLLLVIPEGTPKYREIIQSVKEHVIEVVSDNFSEFIDADVAFSMVDYEDDGAAGNELKKLIEKELIGLGLDFCADDVSSILESYDVTQGLYDYYHNLHEEDEPRSEGPAIFAIDEIDDLFDRG